MAEETQSTVEQSLENQATENSSSEAQATSEPSDMEKAQVEIASLKDSWQRERAEFQNYKRRTANDLLNARKDSTKRFAESLLAPIDNLDRVLSAAPQSEEFRSFLDGVRMIQKEFLSVLERENIKKLDPTGQSFDPMQMEAIASEEKEDVTEEVVLETYQFGFYHQDGDQKHSIRPARVKVAKPKSN